MVALIAGRIWWINRKVLGNVIKSGSLMPAVIIVIELGAIYPACLVILLSLYLSGSYAQYIALDAVSLYLKDASTLLSFHLI